MNHAPKPATTGPATTASRAPRAARASITAGATGRKIDQPRRCAANSPGPTARAPAPATGVPAPRFWEAIDVPFSVGQAPVAPLVEVRVLPSCVHPPVAPLPAVHRPSASRG